jgi:hypothetical protein
MFMPSYIVFHPDKQRISIEVTAKIIRQDRIEDNWCGYVRVDSIGGNQDPWCRAIPWLYSYCHATQLKRSAMGAGDVIFFVSGDSANEGVLVFDTVFVVKERHDWVSGMPPTKLLKKYPKVSEGWKRHLIFGAPSLKCCEHTGRYTFEAQGHEKTFSKFSYLPITNLCEPVSFSFDRLSSSVEKKLKAKTKGKYPVELTSAEATEVYQMVENLAKIKVIRIRNIISDIHQISAGICGCKKTKRQAKCGSIRRGV